MPEISNAPKRRSTPLDVLERHPRSLRAAINAKCWECVGGDADPNPHRRVRRCACPECPLWAVRPWQEGPGWAEEAGDDAGAEE